MKPMHVFTPSQRAQLYDTLDTIAANPYSAYAEFCRSVTSVAAAPDLPSYLPELFGRIRQERAAGVCNIHVLRGCPMDEEIPELSPEDPVADKHAKKKTFIGEAFLALVAQLSGTPLLAYSSRNNGDFFTDVVAIARYHGMQTGFSDSELVYHNDRTAHWARADYISLLGMRCPPEELIFTSFVDGRRLLEHISVGHQEILRKPYFVTAFDVYSRDTNSRQVVSEEHPILEDQDHVRYLDTLTTVAAGAPVAATQALLGLKNALVRASKQRHRMLTGDLLLFANQAGLHSRDNMEINDAQRARTRWLLKTYAFRDDEAAERFAGSWHRGARGLIAD